MVICGVAMMARGSPLCLRTDVPSVDGELPRWTASCDGLRRETVTM